VSPTTLLFDPKDPDLRRDPYPTYRRMREESPVWQSPEGIWYLTRYQDCLDLFHSPALSHDTTRSKVFQAGLSPDPEERAQQVVEAQKNRSILDADPPEHTRLRSLINRAFTPAVVEASRPLITEFVDDLIDDLEGSTADLVEQFSSMLPILVICRMLGVPTDERHEFLAIADAVARSVDPGVPVSENLAANARLRQYITGLIELRRSSPGDDLMTRLIEAADDGRLAGEDELMVNTGTLLVAGFETTTNLLTNAVYRLLQHPDQLEAFVVDRSVDRTCVEEVLRFDPPSQFVRARTIAAETEIGGFTLQAGDGVIPVLAAANRDPDEFDEPERFTVTRRVNRHLSFGVGHHLCIGATLARTETAIALRRLFERFPDLALAPDDEPEYRPNLQLRGFSRLPVRLY
jgi:cytochrome P450